MLFCRACATNNQKSILQRRHATRRWFAILATQSSETGHSATSAMPHSGCHAVQSVGQPSACKALAKHTSVCCNMPMTVYLCLALPQCLHALHAKKELLFPCRCMGRDCCVPHGGKNATGMALVGAVCDHCEAWVCHSRKCLTTYASLCPLSDPSLS